MGLGALGRGLGWFPASTFYQHNVQTQQPFTQGFRVRSHDCGGSHCGEKTREHVAEPRWSDLEQEGRGEHRFLCPLIPPAHAAISLGKWSSTQSRNHQHQRYLELLRSADSQVLP